MSVQVICASQHSSSANNDESGRLFWSQIATFIDDSEYFPIEFNVPDIMQGIGQGIGSMYNYVSTWAGMFGSNTVVPKDDAGIPSNIPKIKSVKKKKKKNKEDSIWNF